MKKTPWFPGSVKPVHVGVYERNVYGAHQFSMWNGKKWLFLCPTAREAAAVDWWESLYQRSKWRGIVKDAK